jgi:hypothetical protein
MDIYQAMDIHLGYPGRMLSGSKQGPHSVYWNACVFLEDGTQVWHGDLDTEGEASKVQAAANEAGVPLFLTPEQPFRFSGLKGDKKSFGVKLYKEDKERIIRFDPEGS